LTLKDLQKLTELQRIYRIKLNGGMISEDIKFFDLETAKKLYQMLGCVRVQNSWIDINHLSSALNNNSVMNIFNDFKFKKQMEK